jgi:hypothetical protein
MATQYTAGLVTGQVLTAATMNSIGAVAETYTPTVTQLGAVTGTVNIGRYQRIQNMVNVWVQINITGTGTANNSLVVSLPITAKNTSAQLGIAGIYDASVGAMYMAWCFSTTSTSVVFAGDWAGPGTWGTIPNLAIGNSDAIWLNLSYEAA